MLSDIQPWPPPDKPTKIGYTADSEAYRATIVIMLRDTGGAGHANPQQY